MQLVDAQLFGDCMTSLVSQSFMHNDQKIDTWMMPDAARQPLTRKQRKRYKYRQRKRAKRRMEAARQRVLDLASLIDVKQLTAATPRRWGKTAMCENKAALDLQRAQSPIHAHGPGCR
jgi:hypothetical protein